METIESIIVILVALIVIIGLYCFVQYLYKHQTSEDTVSLKEKLSDEKRGESKNDTVSSQQIDLYKYQAKTTMNRCPFCDGENEAESITCSICGRKL